MRKAIYTFFAIIAIVLCATSITYAEAKIIERFTATKSSDAVNIEWTTISEDNVARFEVQRMAGDAFKTINTKSANGIPSTYKYTDTDNFTKGSSQESTQGETTTTYRIKIVYSNSQVSYTEQLSVNREYTAIKRTLGMLKEMFK